MSRVWEVLEGLPFLLKFLLLSCVLLQGLCFLIAAMSGCKEWYFSAFFLFTSCACLSVLLWQKEVDVAMTTAFLYGGLFGLSYPCLCLIVYAKNVRVKPRLQREREAEKELFVLPEKHNDFLRDRLQKSLCERADREVEKDNAFQLAYANKAIEKLRRVSLSPADRLEVESIAEGIQKSDEKSAFSSQELRSLNDMFSKVLKLSAKYAL